jgi:predicted dehydrogenase
MLRIGLIGCGWAATARHGPALARYAALPGAQVELAACCDLDQERAEGFRGRFGFRRAYSDWQAMLSAERPDAVCLLVPPALACEMACAILALGCPLLLEKPPGLTIAEHASIRFAAQAVGVPVRVAFNRRYTPLVRILREAFQARFQPEELRYLRYDFTRVGRRDADFSTTAIHGLDAAAFLAGSPYRSARFHYQPLQGPGPQAVNVYIDAVFASGALGRLEFFPLAGLSAERATLHLQEHTFFLELPQASGPDGQGRLRHLENGRLAGEWSGAEAAGGSEPWLLEGFYAEDALFLDALAGRPGQDERLGPLEDLDSSRQSVALMQAMRERRDEWSEDGQ